MIGGTLYAQTMAPGFDATATYWAGPPPAVKVSISHDLPEDRISDVELVLPEGGSVRAERLDTDTVTETRTVTSDNYGASPGAGVGFGFGTGGYSGGGVGIGFGFPIFGGGSRTTTTTETVTKEIRTEAEIEIQDSRDYDINWSFYKIRITIARANGGFDNVVIGAPRP